MNNYTLSDIRAVGQEELIRLQRSADNGDAVSQCKLGIYKLYHPQDQEQCLEAASLFEKAGASDDVLALLFSGFTHEHAIGIPKDYARAVERYSRAYDILHGIGSDAGEAGTGSRMTGGELDAKYDKLISRIAGIVSLKSFCQYSNGRFLFPWKKETVVGQLGELLPSLSKDVAEFRSLYLSAVKAMDAYTQGLWDFRYQDTLLMPLEVIKSLAARSALAEYMDANGLLSIPADPSFDYALGRCLIDDDDAYDNDYIISGLLLMAGHDDSPLWQYRVGLWYEYCENNLEPKAAVSWYEKAQSLPVAETALGRVKASLGYRILENPNEGTAEDCKALSNRSSKNPQNHVGWIIEAALRGDESALHRLEQDQLSPKGASSVFSKQYAVKIESPFYRQFKDEFLADKKVVSGWVHAVKKDYEQYLKKLEEEARRKAEEERKRLEAIRRAEEEARKRAEEEEKARLKAEEDARKKAEEEEKARLKAEEKARNKAEAAKQKAEDSEKTRQITEQETKKVDEELIKAQTKKRKQLDAATDKTRKNYEALKKEWAEKGMSFLKDAPQKLERALTGLENGLREDKRKCGLFQTPLYKKKGWKSIEECVSAVRKSGENDLSLARRAEDKIGSISNQIVNLLDSMNDEQDMVSLESKQKECHKLLREYKSEIKSAIDEGGLFGIENVIYRWGRWEKGIPYEKPKSTLDKILRKYGF